MADQTVTLRITANADGLVTAVGLAKNETKGLGDEGQKAGKKLGGGIAAARAEIERTGGLVNQVKGFVGGLAAAFASFQTIRAVAQMADQWSDLTSRVRLSIGEYESASDVMSRLHTVAQQTYSSFELTAETFTRNATTLNALGVSTQRQLDYAQALNNALVVSGAKAERAEQVQNSLAKAMAEGTLHGLDFNNVLNHGSRVAKALADELNTDVVGLRALAADGKITGDVILNALIRNMQTLTDEAESMPATVGDAFVLIRNSVMALVGQTDEAAGSTGWLAEQLITVAQAIDIIAPEVRALTESWTLQGAAQEGVSTSAEDIAYGMKTVVTGLILAKNAVDVVIAAFRGLIRVGVAVVAEVVDSFGELSLLPEIAKKAMSASTIKEAASDLLGIFERNSDRMANIANEVGEAWKDVVVEFDTSTADVATAFAFLEGGMRGAQEAATDTGDAFSILSRDLAAAGGNAEAAARALAAAQARLDAAAKRVSDNARAAHDFREAIADLAAQLDGPLAVAEREHQKRLDELQELLFEGIITYSDAAEAAALYDKELDNTREKFDGTAESAQELENILRRFDNIGMSGIVRDLELVKAAMAEATDPAQIARLQVAMGHLRQEALVYATDALGAGIQSLKSMAGEGTKALAALETAQAALNLATAIGAIANQGMGDPYTAFARIAAMAAMMAQFVDGLGSVRGGFANTAAQRQEQQGTGTVLGDAAAKSESIARAVEITAQATQQLVGINRSMLAAMQNLQAGLSGASTLLARGAGDLEFAGARNMNLSSGLSNAIIGVTGGVISLVLDKVLGGALTNILNKLIGGKSKVTDQGILIMGGVLSDMIENVAAGAYQEVQSRSWWFGSTKTSTEIQGLGDDVARQFQLVLQSMADAVRAGAQALGLDMEAINAAIESYRIAEVKISTMDLSAEDAQKELEAVFSSIFDGLAGAVVPFIAQFQQVGEGLGETLIRVATGVQVAQEAVKQLGFALDETDPERLAQISTSLMDLAGGVDAFIEGMSSFVNAFASDQHKFKVAQDALTSAFEQFGLVVPDARDGMWDLMQSLDATTESGQRQIAMLLQLADVADSYYQMLEQRESDYARFIDQFRTDAELPTGANAQTIIEAQQQSAAWVIAMIAQANDLARAAGLAGAAEEDLVLIHQAGAAAVAQAAERIRDAITAYDDVAQGIADRLAVAQGASTYQQELVRIEREYRANVQALDAAARAAGRAGASERDLARAMELATLARAQALAQLEQEAAALAQSLYGTPLSALDEQIAALQESESAAALAMSGFSDAISDAARAAAEAMGLLLGSYSPLRASDKLPLALEALRRGETDANTVLGIARDVYSSGRAYNAVFDQVQAIVRSQTSAAADSGLGGAARVSPEMQALLDQRAQLQAEQAEAQRFAEATQLSQMVAELARVRGEDYDAVAQSLGFSLEQFARDLRLDDVAALADYLDTVTAEQNSLAALFDTPTAGDLAIIDAIEALKDAPTGEVGPVGDPIPVVAVPSPEVSARDDRQAEDMREVRDLLRVLIDRGVSANEDAATAGERTADAVERLVEVMGTDDAAVAAMRRRGG